MSSLRSKLIRLAHEKPELRGELLPLLTKTAEVFHSQQALQKYLKDHPNADPSNHSVDTKKPPPLPPGVGKPKSTPPPVPADAKKPKSTPPPIPEAAKKPKEPPPPPPKTKSQEEAMKEYIETYKEFYKKHPPPPGGAELMKEIMSYSDKDFGKSWKKKASTFRGHLIRLANLHPAHRPFLLHLLDRVR
jgi:type IV secretory pathway VirB10-like protein